MYVAYALSQCAGILHCPLVLFRARLRMTQVATLLMTETALEQMLSSADNSVVKSPQGLSATPIVAIATRWLVRFTTRFLGRLTTRLVRFATRCLGRLTTRLVRFATRRWSRLATWRLYRFAARGHPQPLPSLAPQSSINHCCCTAYPTVHLDRACWTVELAGAALHTIIGSKEHGNTTIQPKHAVRANLIA